MSDPLVSVIVPVYNREHCIKRAIDSVLAQSFRDFEVVVVDDGSKDGTAGILKSYGESIRLIRQENAGVSAARNTAIRAARGRWIAFLDSDDEWRPEKLEWQMKMAGKYETRVCFSRSVAEDGKPLPDLENVTSIQKEPGIYLVTDPLEFLTRSKTHPYLQSILVEKKMFETTGLFDQALHAGEDTLWLFRLSFLGSGIYVDRPMTVIHRYTDNSLTYDLRPEQAEKRFDSLMRLQAEMHRRLLEARPDQAGVARGRLAYCTACRAELACAAGQPALTRKLSRDGMALAGDFRTFVHCAALWLAPGLWRGRFRKKWHYQ